MIPVVHRDLPLGTQRVTLGLSKNPDAIAFSNECPDKDLSFIGICNPDAMSIRIYNPLIA